MPDYTFPVLFEGARISSEQGMRTNPVTGKRAYHGGIDIAAPRGAPVVAPTDITITRAQMGSTGGFGNVIYGVDGAGDTHIFGHLDSIGVKVGDMIPQGMQIGGVGSSGRSTGNHLHYEVRDKEGKSKGGLLGGIIKRIKGGAKALVKCGPNAGCIGVEMAKNEVTGEYKTTDAGEDRNNCFLNPICYLREWLSDTSFIPRASLFLIGGLLVIGAIVFLGKGMVVPNIGKAVK